VSGFQAAIFDLDGVLVDSAKAHFVAWRRLAGELGIAFTEEDNEALKGLDRMASLRTILALGGRTVADDVMAALAARKNEHYLDLARQMSPADQLPGAEQLVRLARMSGLKCAVASASRNAPLLLERVGFAPLFDFVADSGAIAHGKPAPDIFLACSGALGVAPGACLAFEDAAAGIEAIIAAGMFPVGIGDPAILKGARITFPNTSAVDLPALLRA
jgi:beta-phosphoglucomutase